MKDILKEIKNCRDISLVESSKLAKEIQDYPLRELSIDYIQKIVCRHFNISLEQLHEKTRKGKIVKARQIAMYFSDLCTGLSSFEIGWQIGRKDHVTCLWSIKQVKTA